MNINPDLRAAVTAIKARGPLPPISPVLSWVGREYGDGECWKFVRDAFDEVGGIKLPDDYYSAVTFFTQVHPGGAEPYIPQPWDVPMLRTVDNVPILVLHPGLVIDGERFMQTWGNVGAGIFRLDDERISNRIVGYIRLIHQ